jgi:hypothetical protein
MNKFSIVAIASVLALGVTYAYAAPGGEGNNTGCNGQGNPNSPCEPSGGNGGSGGSGGDSSQQQQQGQAQGQAQGQVLNNEVYQGTNVGVESDTSSNSESSSHSSSNSGATGGSVRNSNSVQGGRSDSSSTASGGNATGGEGGDARAYGGVGVGGTGEASASSGGNTQDLTVEGDTLTDNSVLIYEDAENSSASAASVFAGYCQTGASAQMQSGGFSVVNPEAFCNNIRMAGVYQEAYVWELAHGKLTCSEEAGSEWVDNQYMDTCVNEQAATYYKLYGYHVQEAHELLSKTEDIAVVDAWAGYLIRPVALIALLFLL